MAIHIHIPLLLLRPTIASTCSDNGGHNWETHHEVQCLIYQQCDGSIHEATNRFCLADASAKEKSLYLKVVSAGTNCFCVGPRGTGCLQTAGLWDGQIADREERSDECDNLCLGLESLIQPLKAWREVNGCQVLMGGVVTPFHGPQHRGTITTIACFPLCEWRK